MKRYLFSILALAVLMFSSCVNYVDLSLDDTANCYMVSTNGCYKFRPVKGNSTDLVTPISSVEVLWESFGTEETPNVGELVSEVTYEEGYIAFKTPEVFKEGNAVIAVKDDSGEILWSWHIWLTDQPQEQVYYNNAGTMMDRNLGATSATPGDVGALGLLYQWGRKDPFLGSASISEEVEAKSTITWPSAVEADPSNGTIEYATSHPTTFITYNWGDYINNYDWYYTGSGSTDNTRWTTYETAKSIYDPCPAGWRVPDGGTSSVWEKALAGRGYKPDFNKDYRGCYVSRFGADFPIWYPAAGSFSASSIEPRSVSLSSVGSTGQYLAATSGGNYCYGLVVADNTFLHLKLGRGSVRCIRE